ncbi:hypothetical protein [Nitrosospira briensis]|uniref:hypothetical protein n=1 Tax=Nitrosospira briensis TaxID=35799 RepID=UPI00069DD45A|nr:hypothetical protein [Nitrosospira briensis]
MLSETRSEISCLDRRPAAGSRKFQPGYLQHQRPRFSLESTPQLARRRDDTHEKGHVLVLKEKNRPCLSSSAGGGRAHGYGQVHFFRQVKHSRDFSRLTRTKLISQASPIVVHPATPDSAEDMEVFSTLERSRQRCKRDHARPDGRVYLLSQEGSALIRLERILKPDENKVGVDHGAYWNLPAGLEKAEGW